MRGTWRKLRLTLTCAALLLCGLAGADRQTFGAWSFALDVDVEASVENGVRAFRVGDAAYLFTPPEPLAGRSLEAVATATIADLTRGQASDVKFVRRQAVDGGGTLLAYSGVVVNPANPGGSVQTYFFFGKEGQWGLALLMMGAGADPGKAVEVLGSVTFRPSSLTVVREVLPKLPAVPWSTPRADRGALSKPGVDFPTARRRGLDPEQDLLPDNFECYYVGESGGSDLRAMTPTPDLRVGVSANGTYAFTDGVTRAQGGWTQTRPATDRHKLTLTGPLVARDAWVYGNDDHGQNFTAFHAAADRKVTCYQAGPRAEELRLTLTRKRIGGETLTCQDAGGGAPYALNFGAGTYTTPKGGGRTRLVFSGRSGDDWQGLVEFSGGPLDLLIGEMDEDGEGNRELEVEERTSQSSLFYSESSTRLVTTCRARVAAKPSALYGPAPAPKTGVSGGPDGLFVSYEMVFGYIGNFPNNRLELQLSLFRPDGSFLKDIDPTDLGTVPDCGRTRPNGDPFCDRYEIGAGKLRTQDGDGEWSDPEAFKATADGFQIGNTRYYRMGAPTGKTLPGVYSSSSDTASGPAGGVLVGGAGIYNTISSGYLFTADGRVGWKYDSSSQTLISPNLITGGGATGGGSSTRRDGAQGTYTLKDGWLTLKFADGRQQRLFVYTLPGPVLKEDATLGDRLNIGGSWLRRVGGP